MKKILVPVDFSKNAQQAFLYAIELGELIKTPVKAIYFCRPVVDALKGTPIEDIQVLAEQKEKQLEAFVNGDLADASMTRVVERTMVETEVVTGFVIEELERMSKSEEVELIVMGTTGEGGWLKKTFGSVSSAVAQSAHCPVLLVPPGAEFNGIQEMIYASNYEAVNVEAAQKMAKWAERLIADIHLVHVQEEGKAEVFKLEELVLQRLMQKNIPEADLQITTVESKEVWAGLYQTAMETQADMIVMVTHHRNFWDRLWHKSQTREMIQHSPIPLLILHLETLN